MATTEASADFDLLVVGGGINGAGIARDAAGRGMRVCLIEQHDLAAHTSSASTKLIHGGLRYLEQGELRLVRESLAERERLLAIAPHIIRPLRFVLPYVDGLRPRWLLRLGLFIYDHAGGRERLQASTATPLTGTSLGDVLRPELRDGFEYSDCWVEDSRLVVLNAMDAAARGASIRTHTQLTGARAEAGLWQVSCRDASGRTSTLTARALVNATGAWVNDVLKRLDIAPRQRLRLVKGSHLILRRIHDGDQACLLQSPDRRVIFMIPFEQQYTLVGTTDVPFDGDPAAPGIDATEQQYLLDGLNRFLRRPVVPADIVATYSGVRPLFDDGSSASAQKVSRDYHLELQHGSGGAPVLTVYGGKITTYRRLAEHALQRLASELEIPGDSWTADEPLPGGDLPGADLPLFISHCLARWPLLPAALVERLARTYGTRTAQLVGGARELADLGRNYGAGLTSAEIRYLVENEWARGAEDILLRRTRLGLQFPASALHDLQDAVAQLAG
ncbi:MAG TPA: glycerol-3-phosphate dehydrogenase [Steroidobacteraceae bacterium]|nr:glycerol-3-phosphate dehydrogenase [Steroidobacteraceae bacterium]